MKMIIHCFDLPYVFSKLRIGCGGCEEVVSSWAAGE
jgi:hypothetical protein